jgi:hypothetical protein
MPAADKTLAEIAPEPTPTVAFEPAPTFAPDPTLMSALAPTVTGAEYEPPTPVPERAPAASLPPPNGAPPAARAATLLATPTPSIGASGRARMMTAMQQTVGNARVGAMLQTAPAPAPEGAVGAPAAPPGADAAAPGAGAAQPTAQGEAIAAAPEEEPSGPAEPSASAAAVGGPGAAPAPTKAEGPGPEVATAAPSASAETTPEAPAEPAVGGPEPAASPPRTPDEDPGFQATVKRVRAVARRQRAHQPAPAAAASAQAAAPGPPIQVPAEAGARQVNRMGEEQKRFKPFDRASFKQRLRDKISLVGPKNPVEAREFSSSPQLASLKNDMTAEVAERKDAAQAGLPEKATPPPDASGIEPKPVDPLGPIGIGPAPVDPGAGQATPKPLAERDVSGPMTEGDQQLDDQMAAAQVTEAQFAAANEPSFTAALQAKQEAKAHAQQASQTFRQEETSTLAQARQQAAGSALEQAQAMHAGREQSLTSVRSSQTNTMTADQRARAEIAAHLEGIYKRTSECVRASLTQLDTEVNLAFERGVEAARKAFEDFVEAELDERYSGVLGKATWLDDKLTWGLPYGVARIFQRGRQLYIDRMDALLDEVAAIIETKLNAAMLEIVKGEQEVAVFVASLQPSLQKVGHEAAQAIQGRFDDLELEVTSKRDQLIDSLAQRYRENVTQLDARIEELKAEHRGLLSKAFDAVVGVIKTILELKNMLLNVLGRVGEVVGQIIADPIGFLGNLVSGIRLGLDNFISNIASHLQQAFMSWLFGALQGAGIQLPDQLDLKGVLSIAMQVLGLTYQAIRARAVKLLGEDLVSTLERVAEPFIVLIREGPGGLWEWIKDQLSDLKDKVLGQIQDFLITRVVKAGITWVLSLLNPASAFVRACKLIYDIVMFFVERGRQILDLVNAVIDSVAAIARGSLEGAAKLVESALAKALPVVIGFLASLLNLGGISDKIREIIEKLRAPVTKAVDWLITKAVALVKAGGKLLGFGKKAEEPPKTADPDHDLKLQAGLAAIDQAEQSLVGEGKLSRDDASRVAASVKANHPVFHSLDVVDGLETWDFAYTASAAKKKTGRVKKEGSTATSVPQIWDEIVEGLQLTQDQQTRLSPTSARFNRAVLFRLIENSGATLSEQGSARSAVDALLDRALAETDGDKIFSIVRQAQGVVNRLLKDRNIDIQLQTHHIERVAEHVETFLETKLGRIYIPAQYRRSVDEWVKNQSKNSNLSPAELEQRRLELIGLIRHQLLDDKRVHFEAKLEEIELAILTQPVHTRAHQEERRQELSTYEPENQ